MSYGIIEYNEEGKPKCEICGQHFSRVLSHVRQAHSMNEREYKLQFGFDLGKGICSQASSEKTRLKTLANYDLVIGRNLLIKGENTRIAKGSMGRTKDKVSAQTRIALKDRLKNPKMIDAMKKSGSQVGKSGLGNLKRWGDN